MGHWTRLWALISTVGVLVTAYLLVTGRVWWATLAALVWAVTAFARGLYQGWQEDNDRRFD